MIYHDHALSYLNITRLEQTGEIDNTIIIFQADNGPTEGGNAFPLRGKKSVYSEGGVRVPAFIARVRKSWLA